MQLLGVLTGVLGHLVHPVLDHIQLGVNVIHGGLGLIPQLVGVVLQKRADLVGAQIHLVQVAGDLVHEPVAGVHKMGGGVVQRVQGPLDPVPVIPQIIGELLKDLPPLFGQLAQQGRDLAQRGADALDVLFGI